MSMTVAATFLHMELNYIDALMQGYNDTMNNSDAEIKTQAVEDFRSIAKLKSALMVSMTSLPYESVPISMVVVGQFIRTIYLYIYHKDTDKNQALIYRQILPIYLDRIENMLKEPLSITAIPASLRTEIMLGKCVDKEGCLNDYEA